MKIKIGTVQKDVTCFGNKFWIQIEDSKINDNHDLNSLVGKEVIVVFSDACSEDERAKIGGDKE